MGPCKLSPKSCRSSTPTSSSKLMPLVPGLLLLVAVVLQSGVAVSSLLRDASCAQAHAPRLKLQHFFEPSRSIGGREDAATLTALCSCGTGSCRSQLACSLLTFLNSSCLASLVVCSCELQGEWDDIFGAIKSARARLTDSIMTLTILS